MDEVDNFDSIPFLSTQREISRQGYSDDYSPQDQMPCGITLWAIANPNCTASMNKTAVELA